MGMTHEEKAENKGLLDFSRGAHSRLEKTAGAVHVRSYAQLVLHEETVRRYRTFFRRCFKQPGGRIAGTAPQATGRAWARYTCCGRWAYRNR